MNVKEAYNNLEKIITYGFLSVRINLGGLNIVLKNITDKENQSLNYYGNVGKDSLLYKLALSTFVIGTENLLEKRSERLEDLKNFYASLSTVVIDKLTVALSTLNKRYSDSLRFFEGYCHTMDSRYLWNAIGKDGLKLNYTGTKGIENVGINSAQENWMIINRELDEELVYDRDFNLSILIASSMNPKGAKQISGNYKKQRDELLEVREEIAKYGYDKKRITEKKKEDGWAQPIKSKSDLVRELYRQMRGEKDRHDLFIEQWMEEQKRKAEAAKNAVKERQKEYREKLEEIDLSTVEQSRPVSLEEIEKIKDKKKNKKKEVNGESFMTAYEDVDKKGRFLKKISTKIIKGVE